MLVEGDLREDLVGAEAEHGGDDDVDGEGRGEEGIALYAEREDRDGYGD